MASAIALAIAKRNKETTATVGALRLANDADAELQDVRECLYELAERYADGRRNSLCWCRTPNWDSTKPHEETCQRTRQIAERLEVK